MKTKIYKAGEPIPDKWALQWQSDSMPAPAFNYFDTEAQAKAAALRMQHVYSSDFTQDFIQGYKLIDRVLQRILKRRCNKFAEEVAAATVEEYTAAEDKSEFDKGVLYGALEWLPDLPGGYGPEVDGWE